MSAKKRPSTAPATERREETFLMTGEINIEYYRKSLPEMRELNRRILATPDVRPGMYVE